MPLPHEEPRYANVEAATNSYKESKYQKEAAKPLLEAISVHSISFGGGDMLSYAMRWNQRSRIVCHTEPGGHLQSYLAAA